MNTPPEDKVPWVYLALKLQRALPLERARLALELPRGTAANDAHTLTRTQRRTPRGGRT